MKQNIRRIGKEEIKEFILKNKYPLYRVNQIFEWIWKKNAVEFEMMRNIPLEMRRVLNEWFCFTPVSVLREETSLDGSIKVVFLLNDGFNVEGVIIPSDDRVTACISTQVGCRMNCDFCATAKMGFTRGLYADEIYDQIMLLNSISNREYKRSISNVVYMGMGEPLDNVEEVIKSINILISKEIKGWSPSRITVSTCGIPDGIRKIGSVLPRCNLAISLNSAINNKRSMLMPINRKYNLQLLSKAIEDYYKMTKQIITFEYVMINNVNDNDEDLDALIKFASKFFYKINLIEYNPHHYSNYLSSSEDRIKKFVDSLKANNINVTVRRSKGKDIGGACGQLCINIK